MIELRRGEFAILSSTTSRATYVNELYGVPDVSQDPSRFGKANYRRKLQNVSAKGQRFMQCFSGEISCLVYRLR